jgi:hypothetical protein
MNLFVVLFFALIMVFTILTMTIIIKFLKNKALIKKSVKDQIQVDLALLTLLYVITFSSVIIVREIFGPFTNVTALNTCFLFGQWIFNSGFNCVISLQLMQLYNIFSLTAFNDWPESQLLCLHRTLVFTLGILCGSAVCKAGGGMCNQATTIYYHFVKIHFKKGITKPSLLSVISMIFYVIIIITLQTIIETKRFFLNRADQKADNLALTATRQLQAAKSKLTHVELGVHNFIRTKNSPPCLLEKNVPEIGNESKKNKTSEKTLELGKLRKVLKNKNHQTISFNRQGDCPTITAVECSSIIITNHDGNKDSLQLQKQSNNFELFDRITIIVNVEPETDHSCNLQHNEELKHPIAMPAWQQHDQIGNFDLEEASTPYLAQLHNKSSRDQVWVYLASLPFFGGCGQPHLPKLLYQAKIG